MSCSIPLLEVFEMKNKSLLLNLLAIAVFVLSACAPVATPPPTSTPVLPTPTALPTPQGMLPQYVKQLGDLPPAKWEDKCNVYYKVGAVNVINRVCSAKIDTNLLSFLIGKYGTFSTKLPLTLDIVPQKYVRLVLDDEGHPSYEAVMVKGEDTKLGMTFGIPNEQVFAIVALGVALHGGIGSTKSRECPEYSLTNAPAEDTATYLTVHEMLGHAFLRANGVAKTDGEECFMQWFELDVIRQLGPRRLFLFNK